MNSILKNKYLWIGVALGLILGDIVGVFLFKKSGSDLPEVSTLEAATSSPYSLTVVDQKAGDIVYVSDVRVATTSWLAVREHNGDLLGNILGARRVPAGETAHVEIELLRPTAANLMYGVVLYEDDGDGAFDSKADISLRKDGEVVLYPFAAR